MAKRTKAKRKGKAKRKKTLVSKVARRKKATAVRQTKAIRKKSTEESPYPASIIQESQANR